ncbi:hypothetical protein BT69DRAFT_1378101 [Atractiella rhizophila]|nr:hypothetical protein BT69DRAFT_1378101 [Atractiella rhizophila]
MDPFQYNPYVIVFNSAQAFSICQLFDGRLDIDRGRPLTPAEIIFAASEISSAAETLENLKKDPPFFREISVTETYQDPIVFADRVLEFLPILRVALHLGPLVYALGDRQRAEHTITLANHLRAILHDFLAGNHPLVSTEWIAIHQNHILHWPELRDLFEEAGTVEESVEVNRDPDLQLMGESEPEVMCEIEERLQTIIDTWTKQQEWKTMNNREREQWSPDSDSWGTLSSTSSSPFHSA